MMIRMRTVYRRRISARFAVALLALTTAVNGFSYSALYVYGDSLSDTGNIDAPPPDYYAGRWSNGSVWVEYLSIKLGLAFNPTNNYAHAGSTTSSLAPEVAATPASTNLPTALCLVWAGGNDFLNNLNDGVYDDASWSNVVKTAASNLTNAVVALYAKGARGVLVCNLPDLGKIPELVDYYSSAYQSYVSSRVVLFNSSLTLALAQVAQARPDLHLYALDVNSHFTALLASPAALGFTVSNVGALDDLTLADKSFTGPGRNYVFWDSLHPTTKSHALIAGWAFELLPEAPRVWINCNRSGAILNLSLLNLTPGSTYTVQSSTNLLSWSEYQTFTAVGTNQTNLTTVGVASELFYRVQRQ
jgi:phospholipase/lecithinase/hemolysin